MRFAPLPWVPFTRTAILCFPARRRLNVYLTPLTLNQRPLSTRSW